MYVSVAVLLQRWPTLKKKQFFFLWHLYAKEQLQVDICSKCINVVVVVVVIATNINLELQQARQLEQWQQQPPHYIFKEQQQQQQ